jgi:hypothetical protein
VIRSVAAVLAGAVRPTDAAAVVRVDGGAEELTAEILDRPAPADAEAAVILAEATIGVGVEDRQFRVLIGPTTGPDAVRTVIPPGGLQLAPIVVVADAGRALAEAGARRAGRDPSIAMMTAGGPRLAAELLRAVSTGAEVVIVTGGDRRTIELAGILGGRPVPAASVDDHEAIRAMLRSCRVEADVPLPSLEGSERERAWELMRSSGLDRTHRVVEVDPRPAFDELGVDPRTAPLADRAAGAAGVLAGRLAAENRRWRATVD